MQDHCKKYCIRVDKFVKVYLRYLEAFPYTVSRYNCQGGCRHLDTFWLGMLFLLIHTTKISSKVL